VLRGAREAGAPALPADSVDAALINAADLTRLGDAATTDLALPE
jgi:hypothetical protein